MTADERRTTTGPNPETGDPEASPSQRRILMDVVAGPNFRLRDNFWQAIAIAACTTAGAAVGAWRGGALDYWYWSLPPVPMWMIGTIVCLTASLVVTGGALMIYRLFRH